MTVSRITPPTGPIQHTRQPAGQARVVDEEPAASRALVPVERAIRTSTVGTARPDASFVAHLIAMAEQAPQTRVLRKATSVDARAIYERMTARGNDNGKVLSQTA